MYYYLYLPINWIKDLSDVGYDYLTETPQYKAMRKSKRELVKEVRRRRRIGDLPPVYPNGWFALAESSDVPAGQVKYVEALGENFAVFRSKDGRAYVLDAYCPHLGANMGIGGVVKGDCLECPFHGWQFRGQDGKCSEIPYAAKVPSFAKVKKWESCEVNDFIFVWYHAEGEAPSWQVEVTEEIHSGEWWYRGRSEFIINSHIEEIPENGADIAHLNAIHAPSLLGGSDLRYYERMWHSFARHTWSATWRQHTTPGEEHIGTMNLDHDVRLFNKFSFISMKVNARQIGPGYVYMNLMTSIGPIGIVQVVTPIEPLLQRVVHRVYCPPLLMLYATITLIGEAIMIERDIMVWNHKKYVKPLLVKEDQAIVRHRRWYSQFYSANSPRFTFQRDSLDW
ncbi:cholesterol 7-desaturase nvd [Macrosteles quadrilineatus]|uniref:cholesterol 7-desaturase nvd n=1 Tax=Macrosteles quadrilineatus TaxID=74068 RepID=UPI0023E27BCE|nr:cholesterol 7-desaturase nvd [Macrosteles quadrilineatus]